MSAEGATEQFVAHRNLLFTVAYELLGSAADAEDVLQETWLRWAEVDHATVEDPKAYLARICSRLALNRLRTLGRRRESYVGPWLPEPLLTTHDVADDVELADSVSTAMLLVLETLRPVERVVFVLREVFAFPYDEIGEAVERPPATVRQIAHRAREHVAARRPRAQTTTAERRRVLDRFTAAAQSGDVSALIDVLAPDVILLSDGGGVRKAALRPIVGADKVARFLVAVAPTAGVVAEVVPVNGRPAIRLRVDGLLDSVLGVDVDAGRITALHFVRNPAKLARLDEAVSLER